MSAPTEHQEEEPLLACSQLEECIRDAVIDWNKKERFSFRLQVQECTFEVDSVATGEQITLRAVVLAEAKS